MTAGAVTVSRRIEGEGLGRMLTISLLVHAIVLTAIAVAPWSLRSAPEERDVMTISLGGAPGPRAGGMTPMGGRPVQQVEPLPERPRPEPDLAPAPKPPEMTMPAPKERPPVKPPPQVKQTVEEARGRTPTKGPREQAGSTVANTGGRGFGSGLATGGGGGGLEVDLKDFCCPEYLSTVFDLIDRQWNKDQRALGVSVVRFVIHRDGSVTDVALTRSSGYAVLDMAAQRALLTVKLPPLPAAYTNPELIINLTFRYQA